MSQVVVVDLVGIGPFAVGLQEAFGPLAAAEGRVAE